MLKKFQIHCVALFIALFYYDNIHVVQASNTELKEIVVPARAGALKISSLLDMCPEIANAKPSQFVSKEVAGKIVMISNNNYEIRFFGFEDTQNKLSKNLTFKDYLLENNLLELDSVEMKPLPGISFESFDFRRARSHDKLPLNDGVYFSMALRLIETII